MEGKQCSGDCLKCTMQQQVYCAAQHGHVIYDVLGKLSERLSQLEASLARLASSEGIINPIAQGGAGAENRAPSI